MLAGGSRPRLLFVVHGWGGGVRRHVDDLAALVAPWYDALVLEPAGGPIVRLRQASLPPGRAANGGAVQATEPVGGAAAESGADRAEAWFALPRDLDLLAQTLHGLRVARVHFHHAHGHPQSVLDLPRTAGLPFDVTLHDYMPICPQLQLVDGDGRYCGEPDTAGCTACLAGRPPAWPLDIVAWRGMFAAWLRGADRVIAPSHDVARRMGRYLPDLAIEVWPHFDRFDQVARRVRVATLGTLFDTKGLSRVEASVEEAIARGQPLTFRVIGAFGRPPRPFPRSRLSITGEYDEVELPALIASEAPDVLWFPAQFPETYSYTLTAALATGLPIVASAFGAFPERLAGLARATLLPWDASAAQWNQALLAAAQGRAREAGERVEGAMATGQASPDLPRVPATSSAAGYIDRYLSGIAAATPDGRVRPLPPLDERHFVVPIDPVRRDTSLASLLSEGMVCGKAEARAELSRRAALADREIESFRSREVAFKAALEASGLETAAAREQIEALETSTSWRITAPLRSVVLRSRLSAERARAALRGTRHLPVRASLAWTLLREEGPRAFSSRVGRKLAGGGRFRPAKRIAYAQASAIAPLAFTPVLAPRVSIVVPVYGKALMTFTCLASVHAHTPPGTYEVIVVDDASPEPVADELAAVRGVRFERNPVNQGFIGSCNRGAEVAHGEVVVFLNNDTIVTAGWLDALLACFDRWPRAGVVGAKLIYPDGRLQEAGGIVWRDGSAWNVGRDDDPDRPAYNYVREVDYCSGACLAVRTALFRELGGFDRRFVPAYYEDTDLAFAARAAGWKVLYQPAAVVVHFEGQTSGTDPASGVKRHQRVNQEKFLDKWASVLSSHRNNGIEPELERDRGARRRMLMVDARMLTPDQDSGSLRTLAMLEIAVEAGTRVTFVGDNLEYREPYVRQLQQAGVEVMYAPYVRSVTDLIAERGPSLDLVVLARHYVANRHLDTVRSFAPQALAAFDTVDLHFLRAERLAELQGGQGAAAARARRDDELALIRRADVTIVVSALERDVLAKLAPEARVLLLSNIHEPMPGGKPFAQREGLVFIGGFEHPPNTDGVLWYAREVLPRVRTRLPGVVTYVVGSKVPPPIRALAAPDLVVTGFVPDVAPYFTGCRVSISPLRYGAGVKGKVNLAMSYGMPVVATTPSVEGMHLTDGEEVLVADDPEAFAAAVERLYRDEALWRKLAKNGLDNLRRHFSRATAGRALDELFALAEARARKNR